MLGIKRGTQGRFTAQVKNHARFVDWDACTGTHDPFLSHVFLAALEESGSVGPGTGWQASPIVIEDAHAAPLGVLPAYFKGHSQGEYVFDQAWADAWQRAGGRYYPKLQIAVPFTPATGRRLLLRDNAAPAIAPALIAAAEPRHLHRAARGAAVRGGRLVDSRGQPVPLRE